MNFLLRYRLAALTRTGPQLIGWVAAFVLTALFVFPMRARWPHDYYMLWAPGQFAQTANIRSIYSPYGAAGLAERARRNAASHGPMEAAMRRMPEPLDLTASPFRYAVVKLLATGRLGPDYRHFRLLSDVLYVAGILALASWLRFPPWSFPVLALAFTVPYLPFNRDIESASDSAFLAGLVMLAMPLLASATRRGRAVAGFAFGLLACFKPSIVFVVFFVAGAIAIVDVPGAAAFALGVLAAVLAAGLTGVATLQDHAPWTGWMSRANRHAVVLRRMAGGLMAGDSPDSSPTGYDALTVGFLVAGAAAICRRRWRTLRRTLNLTGGAAPGFDEAAAGAAGLACFLVGGIFVWDHAFTLAVPGLLIALRPRPYRTDRGRRPFLLALFAYALLAVHNRFQIMAWTDWGSHNPLALAGAALVFLFAVWDIGDASRTPLQTAETGG